MMKRPIRPSSMKLLLSLGHHSRRQPPERYPLILRGRCDDWESGELSERRDTASPEAMRVFSPVR
jgi:hypothetical protein